MVDERHEMTKMAFFLFFFLPLSQLYPHPVIGHTLITRPHPSNHTIGLLFPLPKAFFFHAPPPFARHLASPFAHPTPTPSRGSASVRSLAALLWPCLTHPSKAPVVARLAAASPAPDCLELSHCVCELSSGLAPLSTTGDEQQVPRELSGGLPRACPTALLDVMRTICPALAPVLGDYMVDVKLII